MTGELPPLKPSIDPSGVKKGAEQVVQSVDKMKDSFKDMARDAAAIAGVGLSLHKIVEEAGQAEKGMVRLQALLRAQGVDAEKTANAIAKLSEKLMKVSTFDDDAFTAASTSLIRMGVASGDTLERMLKLSAGLASASDRFGGVEQASLALGRALKNPGESMRMLEMAGFGVSKAALETAKSLAAAGKQGEAISLIMGELEKKVGNTAEVMSKTLPGSIDRAGIAFNNFAEAIGRTANANSSMIGFFDKLREKIEGAEGIAKGIADGISLVFDALTAGLTPVFDILDGVWKVVSDVVAGFRAIPAALSATTGASIESMNEMVGAAYEGTKEYVKGIYDFFVQLMDKIFKTMAQVFDFLTRNFAAVVNTANKGLGALGITSGQSVMSEDSHAAETFYNNWKKALEVIQTTKPKTNEASDGLKDLKLNIQGVGGAADGTAESLDKLQKIQLTGDALKNRVTDIRREIDAMRLGKEAYDDYKKSLDSKKDIEEYEKSLLTIKSQGYKITSEEIKNLVSSYKVYRGELDIATKAMNAQEEEAKKMQAIYDDAAKSIRNSFKDAFTNIFTDGNKGFKGLFDNITTAYKKMAADIIATRLFDTSSGGIFSALSGKSSSSSSGGFGSLLGGGGSSGGGIGSFLDNIFGGSSSGITAGVADPEFGFMGQLGAGGSGGIADGGGFLSSIFGSGGGFGGSIFGAGGTSFGTVLGNSGYGQIGSMASQLFGLSSGGPGSSIGGTLGGIAGSAIGGPIGSIAGSFLGSTLGGLFDGGDKKYEEAVKQRDLSNQRDQFTLQLSAQLKALGNDTTNFAKSVQAVRDQYAQAKAQAAQYGVSIAGITQAENAQIKKLKDSFQESIDSQIGALTNDPKTALDALKKAQAARYKEAIDAEADMVKVHKLDALELQQFYDQLNLEQKIALGGLISQVDVLASKIKDLGLSITTAIDKQINLIDRQIQETEALASSYKTAAKALQETAINLGTGNLTTSSPKEVLDNLSGQFTQMLQQAKGGDLAAMQNLPGLAQSYLTQSRGYYGSSTAYASDFDRVVQALQSVGIDAAAMGGAQDYKTVLMEEQKALLTAIKENLAQESPDAPLLKDQIAALGVLKDQVAETMNLTPGQAKLLSATNAIPDSISRLITAGVDNSSAVINTLNGAAAAQLSISEAIVRGNNEVVTMLGNYIGFIKEQEVARAAKEAADAAAAARQARIDADIAQALKTGQNLQNALAAVPDVGSTENQHSWGVTTTAQNNQVTGSFSLDRGDPTYDQPRALLAARTITEAMNVVLKQTGITGGVGESFFNIAQKYGSSISLGGQTFNTSLNDYEGMTAFGIQQALASGTGGNPALIEYAKGLNWYDLAGAIRALEQKAVDLGLRGFANGSPYVSPGFAVVGENGPEIVKFNGGESVFPAMQSASMLSNSNGETGSLLRMIDSRIAAAAQMQVEALNEMAGQLTQVNAALKRQASNQTVGSFGARAS